MNGSQAFSPLSTDTGFPEIPGEGSEKCAALHLGTVRSLASRDRAYLALRACYFRACFVASIRVLLPFWVGRSRRRPPRDGNETARLFSLEDTM